MKILGVMANTGTKRTPDVLCRLRAEADRRGLRLRADEPTASLLGLPAPAPLEGHVDEVDAVMVLGGDGTMLRAVRDLNGRDKPVIGVNVGSLGFMTSVAEHDLERALECLSAGTFTTSLRKIIECQAQRDGAVLEHCRALNDVVLTSMSARVVMLRLSIDDEEVSDFVCDGLIVSSPTGSTGHSLSAGGPVLMPAVQAFVVSLICPHTLSTRPLVVPDTSVLRVQVSASPGTLALSVDGQVGQPLREGDVVEVRRGERGVRFIHLPGYSYFGVMRQKLHWRGSNV